MTFSGGQLSQVDSPAPYSAHIMHLERGDRVRPHSFSTIAICFGHENPGHHLRFWFQGEYLGMNN